MLKLIETFSGIGAQAQALKNINADFKTVATADWEIGAIYAYDIIHNGPQDLEPYQHHTKDSLVDTLQRFNLSNDGKKPLTEKSLHSMPTNQLKRILAAINRSNNLIDINTIHAKDLPSGDILTYSFPCQDLSSARLWHSRAEGSEPVKLESGIDRDANNRSTLLWQVERILKEYLEINRKLPRFLLMENVRDILSKLNIDNFKEWQAFLRKLGYVNKVSTLDARNFGVPQSRVRTYMLSVYVGNEKEKAKVEDYLYGNDLELIKLPYSKVNGIGNYLRLDYSIDKYREEAISSTPRFTKSREKMYNNNPMLAVDDVPQNGTFARTITTKQDRNPNSGIIGYNNNPLVDWNTHYRNLTPRECFLLMGFNERQYDDLMRSNVSVREGKRMLTKAKLLKLAGNSIVVPVLEAIFKQVVELNEMLEN